jgi:hypothetical protein
MGRGMFSVVNNANSDVYCNELVHGRSEATMMTMFHGRRRVPSMMNMFIEG